MSNSFTLELNRPTQTIPRGHETILVVDDEPMVLSLTRHLLQRHGYRVLEASNIQAALDLWEVHRSEIKLLLTDVNLEDGACGVELAELLRRSDPGLRVIFTSGIDMESNCAGVLPDTAFAPKPYHPLTLLELVRSVLDTRATPEQILRQNIVSC
jgi:two-component system cell cycle sensor histidine kinase/response regulator CckA